MNDKFQIPNGYSESHLLMYPITLMDIKQKAKNGGYYCTTGLLHDIKWLVHNCMILIIECKGTILKSIHPNLLFIHYLRN